MRAIQAHQSLEKKHRDREEARLRGKKSGCTEQESKEVESFLPPPEDGRSLQCLQVWKIFVALAGDTDFVC